MVKKDWIVLLIIFFTGFTLYLFKASFREEIKKDIQTANTEPEYNVVKIFEYDGCTGYKFSPKNYGSYHYFVKCGKEKITTNSKVTCGKSSCDEDIQTEPKSE